MSVQSTGAVANAIVAREPANAEAPRDALVTATREQVRVDEEDRSPQQSANAERVVPSNSLTSGKVRGLGDFVDRYV